MRKVCFVTTSRSDFSRIESIIKAIQKNDNLVLILFVGGSHLLPDAGETIKDIVELGYSIDAKAYTIVEGADLTTMSKSIGLGCMEFSTLFYNHKPDIVVIHGDRFDIFPAAIAAAMQNIHIAHIQGGEISGSIDETIRHCITKMSHIHFVSNESAAERVRKLGEHDDAVFTVGCPSVDFIKSYDYKAKGDIFGYINNKYGVQLNPNEPYLISVNHPVTTEFVNTADQIEGIVKALLKTGLQSVFIYPNIDAGSKSMASRLRQMESMHDMSKIFMFKHLSNQNFLNLIKHAACLAGNSSSGIREACYFGTPVVNIGSRQAGRKRGANVMDAGNDSESIFSAIQKQLEHGVYDVEEVYGSGGSGEKIAEILAKINLPPIQKRITY